MTNKYVSLVYNWQFYNRRFSTAFKQTNNWLYGHQLPQQQMQIMNQSNLWAESTTGAKSKKLFYHTPSHFITDGNTHITSAIVTNKYVSLVYNWQFYNRRFSTAFKQTNNWLYGHQLPQQQMQIMNQSNLWAESTTGAKSKKLFYHTPSHFITDGNTKTCYPNFYGRNG